MVEVSQCDREAVARIAEDAGETAVLCRRILNGQQDDYWVIPHLIGHRIEAEQRGRLAGMEEAAGVGECVCPKCGIRHGGTHGEGYPPF